MPLTIGEQERAERVLKRNLLKRSQVEEQFVSLKNLVNDVENAPDLLPELQARVGDIEALLTDFNLYQDAVLDRLIELDRDSEFSSVHALVGKIVSDQYYSIKASVSKLGLEKVKFTLPAVQVQNIQLPKIQLPSFDGNILQWRAFRDTFASLVHDNKQLSPIQKFHYLLSAVSGSASSVVKSIPLSEANYDVVWQTLNARFDNTRLLLNAHLDSLFRFTPLQGESLNGLQRFISTFQENVAALKALETDDLSGFILFYIASRVLDPTTKQLFEFEYHDAATPTFDMLLEFVQIRSQVLQNSTTSSLSNRFSDTNWFLNQNLR